MKKIILIVLLVLFGLCLAYVGFNRIDAKADPGMFSAKDLPEADFDYDNGFYRLWTLGLDDAKDVEAPAVKERYRRLFDPRFDNGKEIAAFDGEKHNKKETSIERRLGSVLRAEMRRVLEIGAAPPPPIGRLLAKKEDFARFREAQPVLLRRYEDFLASPTYQDFTLPRPYSPIPNLITWLNLAKVRVMLAVIDAADGMWLEAADSLLRQADFCKKAIAGHGTLIGNLIGKATLTLSLQGLAYLMNQKECPEAVFARVLEALPPIRYEEYGTRNGFIGEFLFSRHIIEHASAATIRSSLQSAEGFFPIFLLQKNRTLNDYLEYLQNVIELEASPLQGDLESVFAPRVRSRRAFWWLRNPTGKRLFDLMVPNMGMVAYKALRTRSIYDMTRISAELHLRYDPARSVQENLSVLATYQTLDPCSGKPYIWNEERQVLYGVGLDRVDGGGAYDPQTFRTDVILPIVLYLRGDSEK